MGSEKSRTPRERGRGTRGAGATAGRRAWAQAEGWRRGTRFLKGQVARRGPKASATGTCARGCGPATCGWRGDPGSSCGRPPTLRVPPLSASSGKCPPAGHGPRRPREPERATQAPRLDLKAPRHSAPAGPGSQLRVFPTPESTALRRQAAGTANGRAQSVNFVFARHAQPVRAGFSQVPPSVSGAPFWQHSVGRRLPPSCVWRGSPLGTVYSLSSSASRATDFLVRQPAAAAIKQMSNPAFPSCSCEPARRVAPRLPSPSPS